VDKGPHHACRKNSTMHLMDIMGIRAKPAAGVYVNPTRQCPMSCAHCSTNSTNNYKDSLNDTYFLRFVASFQESLPPVFLMLTGGEALLRPKLVKELAELARRAGTRSYLLSGLFFAIRDVISDPIRDAIASVDHFSASIDPFHEVEVPRDRALAALERIKEFRKDVSIQTCAEDEDYIADLADEVRDRFDGQVPILVTRLESMGRARGWHKGDESPSPAVPAVTPCPVAGWPVVNSDGRIVACCNQTVVDGPAPDHLNLGHIATTTWGALRARVISSALLRLIRTVGPVVLADRAGARCAPGYCDTCMMLSDLNHSGIYNLMMNDSKNVLLETLIADFYHEHPPTPMAPFAGLMSLGYGPPGT
jgi:pyruvate-formate lyase-activating enzyme